MYRNKYIIGIYSNDEYELCETILENAREFAKYAETTVNAANNILSRAFHHQLDYIVINGHYKKIEFVSMN